MPSSKLFAIETVKNGFANFKSISSRNFLFMYFCHSPNNGLAFSYAALCTFVSTMTYFFIFSCNNGSIFFSFAIVSFLLFSAFVSPSGFQISTIVSINSSSISGVNFLMSFSSLRNIIPIWRQFLTPSVVTKSSFIFSKSSINY